MTIISKKCYRTQTIEEHERDRIPYMNKRKIVIDRCLDCGLVSYGQYQKEPYEAKTPF